MIVAAFAQPAELRIKHVTQLKPLLKPEARRGRVLAEAHALAAEASASAPLNAAGVVRRLTAAADEAAPVASREPRAASLGKQAKVSLVHSASGKLLLRLDAQGRKGLAITLFPAGGGSRDEAQRALNRLLDEHWAESLPSGDEAITSNAKRV